MGIFKKFSKSKYVFSEKDLLWNKFIDEICFKNLDELNEISKIAVLAFWYDTEMTTMLKPMIFLETWKLHFLTI